MDAIKTLQSAALILRESGRSFLRNADLQTAAAMAYYTFLAFIPLCLLAVALLGLLLASSDSALTSLETVATQAFPLAADAILKEVSVLARHRTWGLLGLALLLWSVTPLASSFRTAFGTLFNMVNTLPYWKGKLRDIGGALVLVAL
ncbi:MAG: YihY/virulence factor BrkB family protein, partial [Lentisphaerae bacterium]|nr:YihY/virulence factor BrkB family protein [Lentisphaerota bacterium]